MIAQTPPPPYYLVVFTSIRTDVNKDYSEMSDKMLELASQQDGFLGVESARDGLGITVSYWRDLQSIQKWKQNAEHTIARKRGRAEWYRSFKTRIALVEKDYGFEKKQP